MVDWDNPAVEWYQYHREDYSTVKDRLRACRNVVLRGRLDAATDMLRKASVFAVLSIQTARERHERAFTAYYAADVSLEKACGMTVYGNQKAEWLHDSLANFNYEAAVNKARQDPMSAVQYMADNFKGLSYTKAGFALAMCGMWEVACPDTRTKQMVEKVTGFDDGGRVRSMNDYAAALDRIDQAVSVDEPLFIKQWVMYDAKAQEHARHMSFYREVLPKIA